jgi:magnesium chelatase family protein
MAKTQLGESSAVIRDRVIAARAIAATRFAGMEWSLNSQIPARALRTQFQPERGAMNFLHDELDREHITARGLHKIIRTAWSFADLNGNKVPTMNDVIAAHTLRGKVEA